MRGTLAAARSWHNAMSVAAITQHLPPKRAAYWWEAMLDADLIPGLIRDVEAVKGRQSLHEAECTLRYGRIEEHTGAIKTDIAGLKTSVETLLTRGQAAAWSANWKAWALVAALGVAMLGAMGWMGGQLYALEPLRVQSATKH